VTGALIDPETGEFDPGVAREVKDRISMKHMVANEDGSLYDPSTGITIDICDVKAGDA